jgi:hypothetical protein
MLSFEEKTKILKSYIETTNGSYADQMKAELDIFFFENEFPLDFLNGLSAEKEIENKIDVIIHQMIMHEDEEELQEIIHCCI